MYHVLEGLTIMPGWENMAQEMKVGCEHVESYHVNFSTWYTPSPIPFLHHVHVHVQSLREESVECEHVAFLLADLALSPSIHRSLLCKTLFQSRTHSSCLTLYHQGYKMEHVHLLRDIIHAPQLLYITVDCIISVISILSLSRGGREGVLGMSVCVHKVISKCILDMSVVYACIHVVYYDIREYAICKLV